MGQQYGASGQPFKTVLCQLIWLVFYVLISIGTRAQTYSFSRFEVEDGLAHNTVFSSYQDKRGFLWFGTKAGLNRFDGYQFKLFTLLQKNGTPHSGQDIYSLTCDSSGTLWAGTASGVFYFDEGQQRLIRVLDTIPQVLHIFADDKANLWLLNYAGFYSYHLPSKKLICYSSHKYFEATCVSQSEDGGLWFGTKSRLIKKYDPSRDTFTSYDVSSHSSGAAPEILDIKNIGNNRFLIGTNTQGLKLFDGASGSYQDILSSDKSDKTPIYARNILLYGPDEVWLATETGIYVLSLQTNQVTHLKRNIPDPHSLSDNAIFTLCKDAEGGIWAGTFFGGLNYYSPQYSSFQRYFPDDSPTSISGRLVKEMTEDRFGNLWIGTEDAGLNKFDRATGTFQHYKPTGAAGSLSYHSIHALLCVGDDLWIGTFYHGIDVMDIRTGKVKKHYSPGQQPGDIRGSFPTCFYLTSKDHLLIGTDQGIFTYNRENDDFSPYPGLPEYIRIKHITEGKDGGIWVTTDGHGLYFCNPSTGKTKRYTEIVTSKDTTDISVVLNQVMEDSKQAVWICPENNGLFRLRSDRKTFDHYTTDDGLPSNFVFRTIEDNDGNIWATTVKGLASFSGGSMPLTIYTTTDGLLSNQFNYASGFKDAAGKLYFGSTKGMVAFHPREIRKDKSAPPLYFTGFMAGGKELITENTSHLILPYNQSSFSISFAALSYAASESIRYNYNMQGLGNSWTLLEKNQPVNFTDLPPGKYIFKIKATLPGRWESPEKELLITVTPPFWLTKWAFACYALLLLLLIYAYIQYAKNRVKLKYEIRRTTQLQEFNNEMLAKNNELQQAFRSLEQSHQDNDRMIKIIAHDLRNPIGAIVSFTEWMLEYKDENTEEIMPLLNKTAKDALTLVSELLQLNFAPTIASKDRLDLKALIQHCVDIMQPAATKKQQVILYEPVEVFITASQEKLWRVFSNLLNNAIKFSPPSKNIYVKMQLKGDQIITSVQDEGIGIPDSIRDKLFNAGAEIKRKGTEGEPSFGLGLYISHQIIESHEGSIWVNSQQGKGTTFFVSLPVSL